MKVTRTDQTGHKWQQSHQGQQEQQGVADALLAAAEELSSACDALSFGSAVSHVYNPLDYAFAPYRAYVQKYGASRKKVVFLGMNPGPWGMAQTGIPFGQVAAVRDWLGIVAEVAKPQQEHPKRPVTGFSCPRSEVSGQRLWGFFSRHFATAEDFFQDHLVLNYCPLLFLRADQSRCVNVTPDKLPASAARPLFKACDQHLASVIKALNPEHLVGIGAFAFNCLSALNTDPAVQVSQMLHPSPANPHANRDFSAIAERQLQQAGLLG